MWCWGFDVWDALNSVVIWSCGLVDFDSAVANAVGKERLRFIGSIVLKPRALYLEVTPFYKQIAVLIQVIIVFYLSLLLTVKVY